MRSLQLGDVVIRRNRLFKTRGEVIDITKGTRGGVRLIWVKWAHPTTLPNPSLELEDELDRPVTGSMRETRTAE
jgi:hypothetical protein